ncbi:tRNA modification GTPase [Alcanivorax sp. S71-1-4]|uniref:tRNA uridine-5-carboxymethylaminomethyl(34) synthesis GTPase MnmE n=1 Tax=Alcanivorax sp. S71-1-4 TaxID=1177159 RepID=UPI00135908E0|nr:tRNA uridine-5-carboxymethylaminomethyl(34) synthesis GTPase MnmE [Alcanivorax sp. S71-1-4]KAF0809578.1 tRNA modification GTPase [Alcanivorax sp. S71-1-4]
MTQPDTDTIVAIATAPGRGGVGIVRLSGPRALAVASALMPASRPLTPRHAHFSSFRDAEGQLIDEGLVLYFPGPKSFTGEDVVELQGHGGPVLLDQLVQACIRQGARQARPGEFSMRAFLNDRMDLTQAEGIADLIDAGTVAAARAAVGSLRGAFSDAVNNLVEQLIQLRIYVEAAIDFPEEEIDFLSDGKVAGDLNDLIRATAEVLATARRGSLLREGMTLVIAGRPNAGKSSLLNALAGNDVAIVTDIAGTTRDVLRETIQLDGMPLNLIDTAGLRESPDVVEQEGIRRAWQAIEQADRILLVVDSTTVTPAQLDQPDQLLPEGQRTLSSLGIPLTLILNKADLSGLEPGIQSNRPDTLAISAAHGDGLSALQDYLKQSVGFHSGEASPFSARRRHLSALELALTSLQHGARQLGDHAAGELLAEDLRNAQRALEEITGVFSADDLLGRIFSSFCIGK